MPVTATPAASTAPTAPAQPASPFHLIGELPAELTLSPAGDRAFLVSQAGIELVLQGDDVTRDPLLQRGLPAPTELFAVDAVAGRWPDSLWLSSTHPSGRSGFSNLWQWDGKRWLKKQHTDEARFIVAMQPWTGGRMLAVQQHGLMFEASFRVLSGDARVALPRFTKAKANPDFSFCITQLRVEAFAALPSGHVFTAGQRCTSEGGMVEPAVERWAPGEQQSTLEPLPGTTVPDEAGLASWTVTGMAALSPTDVYVAAEKETRAGGKSTYTPYFAHFDGKAWRVLPPPTPSGVHGLWPQSDGTLFALDRQEQLWSRTSGGSWSRLSLPAELVALGGKAEVRSFWPRAPGDAWAVVRVSKDGQRDQHGVSNGPDYLLHTHPASGKLPTPEAYAKKQLELRLPGPPVEWCPTPFVLLYTLGRKAPADYDYPATRAALKGHTELASGTEFVEFARESRRYFGARVSDFKLGKQLARLVKAKVPGSTPELVCHDPLDLRKLDIDLTTGELRK